MSMPPDGSNPNSPFNDPSRGEHFQQEPPRQRKSRIWLWVLLTIGLLVLLGVLVCCGGGYFAIRAGGDKVANDVKVQLRGNPVIQEHVGDIQEIKLDAMASIEEGQNTPGSMTFEVVGSKSEARLVIKREPGEEEITFAELIMPDETRHQVIPSEETEFDMGDISIPDAANPEDASPTSEELAPEEPTAADEAVIEDEAAEATP